MTAYRQISQCRECNKEFVQWTSRQEFCNDGCRGAYHRRRYRQQAVEEAEEQLQSKLNGDGHGTPKQRKEAADVLAKIVQRQQSVQLKRRI